MRVTKLSDNLMGRRVRHRPFILVWYYRPLYSQADLMFTKNPPANLPGIETYSTADQSPRVSSLVAMTTHRHFSHDGHESEVTGDKDFQGIKEDSAERQCNVQLFQSRQNFSSYLVLDFWWLFLFVMREKSRTCWTCRGKLNKRISMYLLEDW